MMNRIKRLIRKIFNLTGFRIVRISKNPKISFLSYDYQRHNQRRLEHLASLKLNINSSSVLELGAGIGDHTSFFLDRSCQVVTSDTREDNIKILKSRYPNIRVLHLDLDNPPEKFNDIFDVVYCYGTLYHLKNPTAALKFISQCCRGMLLLETCVSFGEEEMLNLCSENALDPTQSKSGVGCRPTRRWIYNQLKEYFEFVYLPITQPNHEEFPLDWTSPPPHKQMLTRAVFIASRQKIINELLKEEIPVKQIRH